MGAWFENFFDGLYARVLPNTFSEAGTLSQTRVVRKLLKVRKGARVLDIPCGTGRVRSRWTFSRGKRTETHTLSMRIFNGADIRALLRAAGFREIMLYGWPPVGRLTRHSRRIIAVGRRPKTKV